MIANYEYYTGTYYGYTIPSEKYNFFAERASDKLARYQAFLPDTEDAQNALKKCSCAISDLLYNNAQGSKNGKKIASESVNGYYSVSFSTESETALKTKINGVIKDYLGVYLSMKPIKVIY